MRRDNKRQIQQNSNIKHVANLQTDKLQQYLMLCHEILQIGQWTAVYLPHVQQPSVSAFQRLYQVQVTNRQSREVKAMHLGSAYFSTQSSQRQNKLRYKFISFLSKLRMVPQKIKILLELEQLVEEIKMGCEVIERREGQGRKQEIRMDGVIAPNQLIDKCRSLGEKLRGYAEQSEKNTSLRNHYNSSTLNKNQLQQYYYANHQLSLQPSFTTILQWRYSACIIASLTLLQKQSKPLLLKFIKQTKQLTKSSLVNISHVARVYAFCLGNICRHSAQLETVERVVYFQLELKKILVEKRNVLDYNVVTEVQDVLKIVREVTEKQVIKKYAQQHNDHYGVNILSKQSAKFINNEPLSSIKNPSLANNITSTINNKYALNIVSTKPSLSQFTTATNRYFLATNRFSLKSISKKFSLSDNRESQSLNKIKEYQLSLRKTRENNTVRGMRKGRIKEQTIRSMFEETEHHLSYRKGILTNKNGSLSSSRPITRQLSKGKSLFSSHQPSTSRPASFTKHLYQSLQQNNHRHQQITSTNLEHEMFMIPEIIYEKPCITFTQITRDWRLIQQMQNQSESMGLGIVASEVVLAKIEVKGSGMMVINGGEIVIAELSKPVGEVEGFVCIIREHAQFVSKINLQAVSEDKFVTLKSIKSLIQSTDLFFELIQQDIKQRRTQSTTKSLLQTHNLHSLQNTDHQSYIAYFSTYNALSTIMDYIKPYVYWYWTRRAKVNGVSVEKREKIDMSDPLKFSIGLESFKKNDVRGCVEMFKNVRGRKCLKQCITYLSQGRQILCRRLTKTPNGKWYIEFIELQQKYMRNFQISQQSELVFPILKLTVKRLKVTDSYHTKQRILLEKTFKKLFRRGNVKKKSLKKKNTIALKVDEQQQQQPSPPQKEQYINMHDLFSNSNCNQLLINNIIRNFISPRFIQKIFTYIKWNLYRQQQEWRVIQNDLVQYRQKMSKQEMRVSYHEVEDKGFEVLVGEDKEDSLQEMEESNTSLNDVLRRYVIGMIDVVNEEEQQTEGMEWRRRQRRTLRKKDQAQMAGNWQFTPHNLNNTYIKQKSNLRFVLNHKLIAFTSFLISMSQTYEQPIIFSIICTQIRKVKIGRVFYTLEVYRFSNLRYFIVMCDTNSEKQWVMYVSERIITLVDLLMSKNRSLGIKFQSNKINVNSVVNEKAQNKIGVNSNSQIPSYEHLSQKQSVSQLDGDSSFLIMKTYPLKILLSSSQLQQSSSKRQSSSANLIPSILNSQSVKFYLQLLRTPYMDKLTIQRKDTQIHFVSRVNSKNNRFSILINCLRVMERKVVRLRDVCQLKESIVNGNYAYLACSYDVKFGHFRFDIYLSGTQKKYVVFADSGWVPFEFNAEQATSVSTPTSSNIYPVKLLTSLLVSNMINIHFKSQAFIINNTQYNMFETFDQLTLPYRDINLQKRQVTTKNSGLIELLKHHQSIHLLVLDYNREQILMGEVKEETEYLFNNIYAECSYKQTKNMIYQNLLRRTYQKVEKGMIQLATTTVEQFGRVQ